MKFISLASLSIFALSAALPASAAPNDPVSKEKVLKYIQDNPAKLNPPCFWSGRTPMDSNPSKYYSASKEVLKFQGPPRKCHTIGDIVKEAGVDPDHDIADDEWPTLSKAFAETVSGQVYALLGKSVQTTSVWLTVEKPALLKNTKVTGTEIWEIQGDGSYEKISGGTKVGAEDEVELE
ncbi:hypothetical protein DXG01_003325 [Tephrocybe rancida]|nr:hypothetical protein DXG01_003325 [Tephrocybe rancida]